MVSQPGSTPTTAKLFSTLSRAERGSLVNSACCAVRQSNASVNLIRAKGKVLFRIKNSFVSYPTWYDSGGDRNRMQTMVMAVAVTMTTGNTFCMSFFP